MGISSLTTNLKFHTGPNIVTGAIKTIIDTYHNKEYLAQCIADLNRVRKFDLYVVDVTEFITTNGPSGPGDIKKANYVVAGTDRVAIDTYCCRYLDRNPQDEIMIKKAYDSGSDIGDEIRETGERIEALEKQARETIKRLGCVSPQTRMISQGMADMLIGWYVFTDSLKP